MADIWAKLFRNKTAEEQIDALWAGGGDALNRPFSPEAQAVIAGILALPTVRSRAASAVSDQTHFRILTAALFGEGDCRRVLAFFGNLKQSEQSDPNGAERRRTLINSPQFHMLYLLARVMDPDSVARLIRQGKSFPTFFADELGEGFDPRRVFGDDLAKLDHFAQNTLELYMGMIAWLRDDGQLDRAVQLTDNLLNIVTHERRVEPGRDVSASLDSLLALRKVLMDERDERKSCP